MKTIEGDIAQMMENLTPPGGRFVVIVAVFNPEGTEGDPEYLEVYGPFSSWKEAADWNHEHEDGGQVYPLKAPT